MLLISTSIIDIPRRIKYCRMFVGFKQAKKERKKLLYERYSDILDWLQCIDGVLLFVLVGAT